jgi:hypothetical protein
MDVYTCRIRPGGHIFHEVTRHDITAAEVALLRHIHDGVEHVIVLKKTGSIKVSTREELERLAEFYGSEAVREVFGPPSSARLPEQVEDDIEEVVKPKKAAPKAKAKKAALAGPEDPLDDPDDDEDDEDEDEDDPKAFKLD